MNRSNTLTRFAANIRLWTFLLLLLGAVALRLYRLEQESLWLDEIGQVLVAQNTWWQTILRSVEHNGNTPLSYLVTHFILYYVGRSEGILRMPSVVWGTLSVVLVFKLGRDMFDRSTGYLASFLMAIMPLHLYYSREVRFYSLGVLLGLLSLYTFWRAINGNTKRSWILYGIVQLVALYAHYYVLVVTAVQGIWLLWAVHTKRCSRSALACFALASGVALVLFMPWLFYDVHYETVYKAGLLNSGFTFSFPSLISVLGAMFFLPDTLLSFANPSTWWACLAWGTVVIGGGVIPIRSHSDLVSKAEGTLLLILLVLAGVSGVLLLDALASYFFDPRQFLIYTPMMLLAVSASAMNIVRLVRSKVAQVSNPKTVDNWVTVFLIIVSLFCLWQPLVGVYSTRKEDWRGTGRYLLHELQINDALLTAYSPYLKFYVPELSSALLPLKDVSSVQQAVQSHSRVWILEVDYLSEKRQPNVAQWVKQNNLLNLSMDPHLRLYLYSTDVDSSQLLEEIVQSKAYTPSTFVFSDFPERAIREGYTGEIKDAVVQVLEDKDFSVAKRVNLCIRAGRALSDAQEQKMAIEILTPATSLDPTNADVWVTLGIVYTRLGKDTDALVAYQKTLESDPNNYWGNHLLAATLSRQGQWEEVIRLEQKAITVAYRDDIRAESLRLLARAYAELGQKESACGALRQAYEASENSEILDEMNLIKCADGL